MPTNAWVFCKDNVIAEAAQIGSSAFVTQAPQPLAKLAPEDAIRLMNLRMAFEPAIYHDCRLLNEEAPFRLASSAISRSRRAR